jgi:hypothetical protein
MRATELRTVVNDSHWYNTERPIIDPIGVPERELVVILCGSYAWQSHQMGIF